MPIISEGGCEARTSVCQIQANAGSSECDARTFRKVSPSENRVWCWLRRHSQLLPYSEGFPPTRTGDRPLPPISSRPRVMGQPRTDCRERTKILPPEVGLIVIFPANSIPVRPQNRVSVGFRGRIHLEGHASSLPRKGRNKHTLWTPRALALACFILEIANTDSTNALERVLHLRLSAPSPMSLPGSIKERYVLIVRNVSDLEHRRQVG